MFKSSDKSCAPGSEALPSRQTSLEPSDWVGSTVKLVATGLSVEEQRNKKLANMSLTDVVTALEM